MSPGSGPGGPESVSPPEGLLPCLRTGTLGHRKLVTQSLPVYPGIKASPSAWWIHSGGWEWGAEPASLILAKPWVPPFLWLRYLFFRLFLRLMASLAACHPFCFCLGRDGARTWSAGEAGWEGKGRSLHHLTRLPHSLRGREREGARACVRMRTRAAPRRREGYSVSFRLGLPAHGLTPREAEGDTGGGAPAGPGPWTPALFLLASLVKGHLPAAPASAPSGRGGVIGRSLRNAPLRTT